MNFTSRSSANYLSYVRRNRWTSSPISPLARYFQRFVLRGPGSLLASCIKSTFPVVRGSGFWASIGVVIGVTCFSQGCCWLPQLLDILLQTEDFSMNFYFAVANVCPAFPQHPGGDSEIFYYSRACRPVIFTSFQ